MIGGFVAYGGYPGSGHYGGGGGPASGPGNPFVTNGRMGMEGLYGEMYPMVLTRGGLSILGYGDGGGGGRNAHPSYGWIYGGGGGSGGYVEGRLAVTPGVAVSYSIGAGGAEGRSPDRRGQPGRPGVIVIEFT